MIHYSCDICGKSINSENNERFRVLIDVEQMLPGQDDSDLEGEIPDEIDFDEFELVADGSEEEAGLFRSFKFDLCRECAESYLRDPLARKKARRLRFMDN